MSLRMWRNSGSSSRLLGRSIFLDHVTYLNQNLTYRPTPNAVHQANLLFLPHNILPRGRKVYKDALTVDGASRYKGNSASNLQRLCWGYDTFSVDLQAQSSDLTEFFKEPGTVYWEKKSFSRNIYFR